MTLVSPAGGWRGWHTWKHERPSGIMSRVFSVTEEPAWLAQPAGADGETHAGAVRRRSSLKDPMFTTWATGQGACRVDKSSKPARGGATGAPGEAHGGAMTPHVARVPRRHELGFHLSAGEGARRLDESSEPARGGEAGAHGEAHAGAQAPGGDAHRTPRARRRRREQKSTHTLISLCLHGSVCSVCFESRPVCTRG